MGGGKGGAQLGSRAGGLWSGQALSLLTPKAAQPALCVEAGVAAVGDGPRAGARAQGTQKGMKGTWPERRDPVKEVPTWLWLLPQSRF